MNGEENIFNRGSRSIYSLKSLFCYIYRTACLRGHLVPRKFHRTLNEVEQTSERLRATFLECKNVKIWPPRNSPFDEVLKVKNERVRRGWWKDRGCVYTRRFVPSRSIVVILNFLSHFTRSLIRGVVVTNGRVAASTQNTRSR